MLVLRERLFSSVIGLTSIPRFEIKGFYCAFLRFEYLGFLLVLIVRIAGIELHSRNEMKMDNCF